MEDGGWRMEGGGWRILLLNVLHHGGVADTLGVEPCLQSEANKLGVYSLLLLPFFPSLDHFSIIYSIISVFPLSLSNLARRCGAAMMSACLPGAGSFQKLRPSTSLSSVSTWPDQHGHHDEDKDDQIDKKQSRWY